MDKTSTHYLGEKGGKYFAERFNETQVLGRYIQSRYFAPFCSPNSVLLDYGCGDGTILRQLPAAKKIGIEVNPHCHKRIRELNEGNPFPIDIHDSTESVGDNTADLVISNHCLEHVPHPYNALSEIKRVLVPGGKFIMVTPYDDWRQKGQDKWRPGDRQNHLYTWSPINLGNLLVEVGFDVQDVQLNTTAWSPKILWIYRVFGLWSFNLACYLLSRITQRREIFSLSICPDK